MNAIQYSFKLRPFRATPDPQAYFAYPSIQSAFETAVRAIVRAEGPVVILGGAGFGKSLLAELIAQEVSDRLDVVKLQSARLCSRQALLQNILYELQLPYRGMSEGELRISLLDRLEPSPETAPEGLLIVVDEAHTLHPKLLDELRLLTNTTRHSQPRVRLILLGNLRLDELLANPELESFQQRIAARCYLQSMKRDETLGFVRHQLRLSGHYSEGCISHDALYAVHAATDGIPRLVNQLMDHALVLLSQKIQNSPTPKEITAQLINEAWADLQQLPSPWTGSTPDFGNASSGLSVEFGLLEDDVNHLDFQASPESDLKPISAPHEPELQSPPNFFAAFTDVDELTEDVEPIGQPPLAGVPDEVSINNISLELAELQVPANANSVDHIPDVDHEKIACLLGEQQEYDSLSHWENDPPLDRAPIGSFWTGHSSPSNIVEPRRATEHDDLFGADFELEHAVPIQNSAYRLCDLGRQSPPAEESPVLNSMHDLAVTSSILTNDDYLTRIQQTADTISHVSQAEANFDLVHSTQALDFPSNVPHSEADSSQQWTLDVVPPTDNRSQVDDSIEDIVRQLNFSAFLVEPYSVEQISLEADGRYEIPLDSIRTNERQQVLMLHRPTSQATPGGEFDMDERLSGQAGSKAPQSSHQDQPLPSSPDLTAWSDDYDDDRDIIVIEETIPTGNRLLNDNLPVVPAQPPMPYTQLFSRLRK